MQMMPQTGSTKSASQKQLHPVPEAIKESAERLSAEVGTSAKEMAERTAHAASDYYQRGSQWLQANYGKTLGVVGLVAAAGVLGYFFGRNQKGNPELSSKEMDF